MQCIHQCIKYCNCLSQQSVSYSFLGPANREVFTSSSFSISSSVSVWSLHSAIGDELWIPWRIADRVLSRKLLALQRPLARLQRCIVIFSLEFWTHASNGAVHSALAKQTCNNSMQSQDTFIVTHVNITTWLGAVKLGWLLLSQSVRCKNFNWNTGWLTEFLRFYVLLDTK